MLTQLVLTNRADIDQKTYFEDYVITGAVCSTCHVAHGPMYHCKCGAIICEACTIWSTTTKNIIRFNPVKRMRKLQRYALEKVKFNSINCNVCKNVVGLRL